MGDQEGQPLENGYFNEQGAAQLLKQGYLGHSPTFKLDRANSERGVLVAAAVLHGTAITAGAYSGRRSVMIVFGRSFRRFPSRSVSSSGKGVQTPL